MDCDYELGECDNIQVMVKIWRSVYNELNNKGIAINGEKTEVNINEFEYNGIVVKDVRMKINPYGIVVNGEQMRVNYDELNSNGIMVNDEKYTKNIPIMPNKSEYFQLQ